MELIAEILNRLNQVEGRRMPQPSSVLRWQQTQSSENEAGLKEIMSNSEEAQKVWLKPKKLCKFCSKELIFKGLMDKDGNVKWYSEPEPCNCPEAQEELKRKYEQEKIEMIAQNYKESGMSRRHILNTFDNFEETPDNREAKQIALRYVEDFDKMLPSGITIPDRNGLFITGGIGVGKTHLVSAIANALLTKGYRVICMTMIDLLDRIKKTYDYGEISEGEVLDLYETVDLLIIDDLGKERATEWGSSKIYTIINGRYERLMPIIVTSNYGDEELVSRLTPPNGDRMTADATIDRLCEMCKGIVLTGESWRSK